MKSTDPRIIKIADQYEDKIRQEFCEYVDFSKVEDMTTNVFLLSNDECVGEHEDLLYNAGKCVILTGDIFIKSKDIISDRTFVHEYIHRISRNRTNDIWYMGLQTEDDGIRISLNEAITEYFCWKIVGYDEKIPEVSYSQGIKYVDKLVNKIGYGRFIMLYFKSQIKIFNNLFEDIHDICENFDIIFQEPPTNKNDRTIFIQIRGYAECGLNYSMDYLNLACIE